MTAFPVKADAKPTPALAMPAAAPDGDDLAVVGAATLKQTAITDDKLSVEGVNQLDRAAVTFGSLEHFHKHWVATLGLSATASWHTEQARALRDPESIKAWELRAVKGKCDDHVRATIGNLAQTKQFQKCGIETNWPSMTICAHDPRVAYSDDKARLLWKFSFACAKEWELRNITYKVGLRRRILLLDANKKLGIEFLNTLKDDNDLNDQSKAVTDDWAQPMQERSLLHTMPAVQLIDCAKLEGWQATPMLHDIRKCLGMNTFKLRCAI